MIKLEVSHGKHKKNEAGKKLTVSEEQIKSNQNNDHKQQENNLKQKNEKSPKPIKDVKKENNGKKEKSKDIEKKQSKEKNDKKEVSEKKEDQEIETIERIKKQSQRTRITIEQLLKQYENAADDIFSNHGHNIDKQMAIKKKLQSLQKEKQERHSKIQKIDQKVKARQERFLQKVSLKHKTKQEKKKQRKVKHAEKKIEILKALSQERLQKQAKYQQYLFNEYKNKVPRYKKYEEQYKQKQRQFEEEVKQKLEKNKKKYAPMNSEELQKFEEEYQEHKYDLLEENERKRQEIQELLDEENQKLNERLWKGQCHKNIKRELKLFQERKREGKTKLQKTKNYGTIVKSQFKPKIDEKMRFNSLTIQNTLKIKMGDDEQNQEESKLKSVARQKFVRGVNQGLVIEKRRISIDNIDKVKQGNLFLQEMKRIPKVRKDGVQSAKVESFTNETSERIQQPRKTPDTTFKQKHLTNPYYRSSLSDKIPSKSVDYKIKDPEIVNNLLSSLKGQHQSMNNEEKVIKYGRYSGVLDLQNRQSSLNKKMVHSINEKLQILSRM